MKLRTALLHPSDKKTYILSRFDNPIQRLEHDAAAAHALMQAIDEWTMAPAIKKRADELMREWSFGRDEGEL